MNLNHVALPCDDLDAATSFYRRLGFRQIVSDPPRYARFECASAGTFSLHATPQRVRDSSVVVYFEVEQLDSIVDSLKANGVAFESGPVDQPWLWREAYLRDPAGNLLCLFRAGSNRRHPPWRLE